MAAVDPDVFSRMGQIVVVLWGLAYCPVASTYKHVPWLIAVFAVAWRGQKVTLIRIP